MQLWLVIQLIKRFIKFVKDFRKLTKPLGELKDLIQ